jgi:peptide/nickel transport system permease protein
MLVGTALVIAVTVGVLVGTLIARRPGSVVDSVVSVLSISLFSIPVFWLGLMLILWFAVHLRWLPSSGMGSVGGPREGMAMVMDVARHMILPAVTLATVWVGQYVRLARTSVSEVLAENYIVTARAVGYGEGTVLLSHALRNALLPVVTVLGLQIGLALTGAVLTETVFSWPGLGQYLTISLLNADMNAVLGATLVVGVTYLAFNLLADLLYRLLDPRVR